MWGGCTRKKKYNKPRATTVNSIFAEISNNDKGADKVFECVKQLEKDEQLFSTYLFDDQNKGDLEVHILAHMNESLVDIFNCRLQSLKEKDIAIVAVHAFYRTSKLHGEWTKCTFPLFTGLLVCYILRLMRRIFEGMHEWGLVELYKRSQEDFEDHVLALLDVAYRRSERKTRKALKINYHALIERQHSHSSACSVLSLLDLAMMAKCEKFLNHSMCRRISNERWTPSISISRIRFIISFFTFFPIFSIPFNRKTKYLTKRALEEEFEKRRESRIRPTRMMVNRVERSTMMSKVRDAIVRNWKNTIVFYSSPCSNFCAHTTFYFLYIFLYATVLLTRGRYEFQFSQDFLNIFYKEIILFVWQVSFIADMIYSCCSVGFKRFRASNPADSTHNFFNIAWISLVLISTVLHEFKVLPWLWGTLVVLWKFFFHVSFIFSSVRIMRVFAADSFFGAIVVMMKKMVYTLWSFLIVFLLFWSTYAIAVVSLLEEPPTVKTLAWSIFSNGAFEIFGEMKDEMQTGNISECPQAYNSSDIRDFTITCLFRTWMLPILLFIYVLVSSVLLVNLVTSFFTNTFEQVRDSSMLHYRYKHYQRLVEFETKLRAPAPFSLLYYLCIFLVNGISFCCNPIFSLCRKRGEMTVTAASVPLMKTEPGSPEEDIEVLGRVPMISESRSVDSRANRTVNIMMDREEEGQGKTWKKMSDKEKMEDIVGFIQKSMRAVQKNMEKSREETIEEEENEEEKEGVKRQRKKAKSSGVGSFFGYWKSTKTGKMKMVFTKLDSIPFIVTRKGKRFYVFEDSKNRPKKHKALREVTFH
ncbi:hypothetical protein PMAYCL1PPCAC_17545 [Pristionchus mayeri]|uniref:Ion transport domain-containing protein n=1 Tax=Pristionchus mayeri TaxID=1317129 RepID=A0AAN5CN32_9BILA|nr:hypothetical protein PMAYCL1PPCAC_17545 [Pristionchus mayeri]